MSALEMPIWKNHLIIRSLIRREIEARFRGTFGGVLWYVFNNIATLALYTVVFSVVLDVRWPGSRPTTGDFALRLFVGLILFNLVAETLNRAPTLILSNPNFVKKIVFPLEVMPLVSIGAALYNTGIAFLVLVAAMLVLEHPLHWTILLTPLAVIAILPWLLGLCWILASLGVYIRDIGQIMPLVTTTLLFLSPIFFPISTLPPAVQTIVMLNPLTPSVNAARDLILDGILPDPASLVMPLIIGVVLAWLGLKCFKLTKRGFADVI